MTAYAHTFLLKGLNGMNKLLKIDRFIETAQVLFCALMFTLILIFGSIQVFGRSIFSAAPPWTEEAMRFCGIYLTLIGSALTVRVDGHVSVDILIEHMKSHKVRAALYLFSRLLCVVFLIPFSPVPLPWSRKARGPGSRNPYPVLVYLRIVPVVF